MRTARSTPRLLAILIVVTGLGWAQHGLGSLQITSPTMAVQVGGSTTTLTAKRIFLHAPNRAIPVSARWYSSNPSIATVGQSTGVVTAVAPGSVTITAVSGPFTVATTVVEAVPTGTLTALAINSPDSSIAKGLTEQYTATATIGGSPVDVTAVAVWNSSIAAVAPVNAAGLAKGMTVGGPTNIQASLTVGATTVNSNLLPLTVTAAVLQSVTVSPSPIFMGANTTLQLTATGHWTDGDRNETNNATWNSSDSTNIAAIGINTGLLTGIGIAGSHAANTGTITVTLNPLAPVNVPISVMTANEAGRFLEQATFGPSPADVAHLQSIGFNAWLTEQFGMSQLNSQYLAAPDIPTLQNRFYFNALQAPDQLRMRAAFALEQIVVISSNKVGDPNAFVPWQNVMERDAFGNYKSLMTDVTLSPAMGVYLDMVNNDKPATGMNPNENYARELLQLFTIGLYQLNADGTQQLDISNNPIPTYDESVVQGFAHVFTGWTFPTQPGQVLQRHNSAYYGLPPYGSPMENFTSNHDTTNTKLLLNGVTLPAGQTAQLDLSAAMDNIFNDSTIGPFVCKQLIEHLVKSNPSTTYVQDVVNVFNNDGTGTRGNLQAVFKAILTDPEARAGDFQVFPTQTNPNEGHLREPVLFMTSVLRALNSTHNGSSLTNTGNNMGQNILTSPTVFNFFPPDYVIPQNYFNPVQQGIFGPEFALETPSTAVTRANFISSVVFGSLQSSVQNTLNSYTSLAGSNPAGLVDALNLRLMHGQMSTTPSGGMRGAIISAVSFYPASQALTRVQTAVYLILSSSQYQVQH
ncbi:MAG TPA: DUF1800 family protein [Terriglobales bacterium]|nr:DUF1800 family protein [Terriglobales bacterium]